LFAAHKKGSGHQDWTKHSGHQVYDVVNPTKFRIGSIGSAFLLLLAYFKGQGEIENSLLRG
jgi:hypothetical protein